MRREHHLRQTTVAFLSIILVCCVIQATSALQASCYGYHYSNNPPFDTVDEANNACSAINSIGNGEYHATSFSDGDAVSAFNRMKTDNIFSFHGHSRASLIQLGETDNNIWAKKAIPTSISSLTNSEFDDMLLAVYEGCNTANTDEFFGNLLEESNKAGIDNALGFQDERLAGPGGYWSGKFWPYLAQGNTIHASASMASDETRWHYFSNYGYGGTNSWKLSSISGASRVITPPQAGALTLPGTLPTTIATIYPVDPNAPVASFSCQWVGNNQIQFIDTSTKSPTNYYWVFTKGSPDSSTEQNPLVTWSSSDANEKFLVTLSARNNNGVDDITHRVQIANVACPVAEWTPTPTLTTPVPTTTTPIPTPTQPPAGNTPVPSFTYQQVNGDTPYTYQFTG
jgi:hypothetical protein